MLSPSKGVLHVVHQTRQVIGLVLVAMATIAFVSILRFTYEVIKPTRSTHADASGLSSSSVLGASTSTYTFKVNVPAEFTDSATFSNGLVLTGGDIVAGNIIYSIVGGTGISVSSGQNPTVTNTGVTAFQGKTGAITLTAGSGISLDGTTITNTDKGSSIQVYKTISASGQSDIVADGNTDTLTIAGAGGLSISTNADTDTITLTGATPDYTLSGWTKEGTLLHLTTITDSVGIGTSAPTSALHVVGTSNLVGDVTIGQTSSDSLTIKSRISTGSTITPANDLGADLGASALRFRNLWVANIHANSSQTFSGQTVFSYPAKDTTFAESSVLINPTTSVANGQLLAFSIAGYERALVDSEGDIVLGYNGATSAPTTNTPLTVYGHNGTIVSSINTSGDFSTLGNLDINGTTSDIAGTLNLSGNNLTSSGALTITPAAGNNLNIALSGAGDFAVNTDDLYVDTSTGNVGVNTAAPTVTFQVGTTMYADNANGSIGVGGTGTARLYVLGNSTDPALLIRQNGTGDLVQLSDNGSLVFVVKDGGNVGIGTTTPNSKLDVNGSNTGKALVSFNETGSNNILVASSSGTNRLVLTSTGNLGIGTTTPVDKVQVAGTISSDVLAGVEGLRLTSGGVTKLALRYDAGASHIDTPSSATNNKFTNPNFDTNITGWDYGNALLDTFSTDLAAGSVNGTTADTGQTRTVTDNNAIGAYITGGKYVQPVPATSGTFNRQVLTFPVTRVTGKTLIDSFNRVNGNDNTAAMWSTNSGGGWGNIISGMDGYFFITPNSSRDTGATISNSTDYLVSTVLRSTGSYMFVKGGIYTNWTLLWIDSSDSTANLFAGTANYSGSQSHDYIKIPTSLWLPTPLAYSTFGTPGATATETTGPDGQIASALSFTGGTVSGGALSITPIVATTGGPVNDGNLITNGNMSSATGWTVGGNWNISGGVATNDGTVGEINQSVLTIGNWYQANYTLSRTSGSFLPVFGMQNGLTRTTSGTFSETGRATSGNGNLARLYSVNYNGTLDDVSYKPLTLSSLFSTVSTSDSDVIADANVTMTAGTQAGLVTNLDSTSTPNNFLIAYHDGTNIKLDKAVGDRVTNGGFETAGAGGADVFGTWTENAGTGTITNETSLIHAGGHAVKLTKSASSDTQISNSTTVTPGVTYNLSTWTRGDGSNAGQYEIYDVTHTSDIVAKTSTAISGTTYQQFSTTFTAPAGCTSVRVYLYAPTTTSGSGYFDDVSVTPTTSDPIYTNLISTATTYSAGAPLRVVTYHSDASTLKARVYYNNALVGTEQTITDAGIIVNTKHGMFSTYASNSFDNFGVFPRGSSTTTYTDLPDTNLTVSQDTSVTYGGSAGSTKLVAGTGGSAYTQSVNVGDTASYTLSALVYTNGSAVTSSDVQMVAGPNLLTTTFTSMGSGWYRATATVTGVASAKNYGLYVHAGKTVYVDNLNLTASSSLASTLYVQNSTSGLGGMNVESTTTLNAGLASLQALIVKGALSQTANLQEWQSSTGTVLSAVSSSGALGLGNSTPNAKLDVISTSEQQRLGYDASNYWSSTIGATGGLTMQGVGTGGSLTLSPTAGQNVNVALSGTGDFAVNTNQLYVDTSTGNIGIGTASATAKLDIAATSGNDALRLTNSGSTIAGLSYGTNYLALATNGTDPTNKLTNGSFESDVTTGGWTGSPTYALNDEFSDTLPATLASGGISNPAPTLGSEIVTNGGMEGTFVSGLAPNWSSYSGSDFTESADAHTGSKAQQINTGSIARQNIALTGGNWIQYSLWFKKTSGTRGRATIIRATSPFDDFANTMGNLTDSTYTQHMVTARVPATATWQVRLDGYADAVDLFDDVSIKPLTLSSLFSTVTVASSSDHTVQADVTMTTNTQAGVVLNLDSASTPTTFVIGYINGTQACLDKNVSGTYTAVIACTNISYVAGQTVKVIQNGTSYSLWYNGAQVGTTQTISNVPTTNIHGVFSTYASNSFANFTVKGGVNGTLATDGVNTRLVTDTTGKFTIGSGTMNISGGLSSPSASDPGIHWNGTNRTAGKIFTANITPADTNQYLFMGWGKTATSVYPDEGNWEPLSGGQIGRDGTGGNSLGSYGAQQYQFAAVLRSTGMYYFIKGGTYTNWSLLWINSAFNTATVYPSISGYNGAFTADNARIPYASFLPTPLAYDTFTRADGAIGTSETTGPDSQTTSALTWTGGAISGNKLTITPTLGDELNGDVGFDNSSFWTKNNFIVDSGKASITNATGNISANPNLTLHSWYSVTFDVDSNTQGGFYFFGLTPLKKILAPTTGQLINTGRLSSSQILNINSEGTTTGTIDNFSVKPLTLSSLFSTVATSDTDVIADTNVTLTAGTQAGLVTNLDSTSSPTNFIIAYHDGTKVYLDKNVGGTYTNLISATTTYSAGANMRVITYHSDANTLKIRVYYNNSMVGSEQTVTDAGIIANTKHGLFSTYSGNTFDNFSLYARGSDNEYANLVLDPLTVTRDTTIKYNQSVSSAKLVAGTTDGDFVESINVGDTSTYNVIAYAYTNGSAVTSSDLSLYYDTGTITTTYTPMGSTGWYKLTGTVTGANAAKLYGVRVKAGKTVYVDDMKVQVGVGTAQTLYVMNTSSGVTGMNVQGLVNANQSGVATYTKAGTISDSDFTNSGVNDGMIGVDTTNHRIYFRENGAWSYAAKAGGFQIPDYEASGLTDGDLLLPYVDQHMSDGAIHGLYQKFDLNTVLAKQNAVTFTSDVTFSGSTQFKSLSQFLDTVVFKHRVAFEDRDMAGKATIMPNEDHITINFAKPFSAAPIITFNLATQTATDSSFLMEGKQATLTNITTDGFTIQLDASASAKHTYYWVAMSAGNPPVTRSSNPFMTEDVAGVATGSGDINKVTN